MEQETDDGAASAPSCDGDVPAPDAERHDPGASRAGGRLFRVRCGFRPSTRRHRLAASLAAAVCRESATRTFAPRGADLMARGKQAAASAARHDRVAVESELIAGRRRLVEQQREIERLRAELTEVRHRFIAESKKLRGMLAECTSPEVEALRKETVELRALNRGFITEVKKISGELQDETFNLVAHWVQEHGLKGTEALAEVNLVRGLTKDRAEQIRAIAGRYGISPTYGGKSVSDDAILAVEKAKGQIG